MLTTDKDGKVKLGPLPKVVAVNITDSTGVLNQNWFIGNHSGDGSTNLLTYPSQVDCIEDESLEFPVSGLKKKSRKNLSLIKTWSPTGQGSSSSDSIVLEDLYEKVEVAPATAERDFAVIKLNKL